MLRQPGSFTESLVVSAVSAALERLGSTWHEVAMSLRDDHEIDFNRWQRGQEFLADDNPLAEWARMYFPRLQGMCADESCIRGYLPESDDEFAVEFPPPVAIFQHKWIHDELYE